MTKTEELLNKILSGGYRIDCDTHKVQLEKKGHPSGMVWFPCPKVRKDVVARVEYILMTQHGGAHLYSSFGDAHVKRLASGVSA